ncbi:hypothetical protein WJX72_004002 [[Myrmecia] bisecta]|uniref:CHAT domain-containing protein n=1 Tax=[Myrmecia] bisecta TaxID=41462 RepID=A0AAW1QBA2_9CHLO
MQDTRTSSPTAATSVSALSDAQAIHPEGALFLKDGWITTAELNAGLPHGSNARLAMLHACLIGSGRLTAEGVLGLARFFLAAGVPCTIVTTWEANTAFAEKHARELYEQLAKGATIAQASCEAARHLITQPLLAPSNDARHTDYSDPFYWAVFSCHGSPFHCLTRHQTHAGRAGNS